MHDMYHVWHTGNKSMIYMIYLIYTNIYMIYCITYISCLQASTQKVHLAPWYVECSTKIEASGKKQSQERSQWLFLAPVKGGRWHIITQLAVYTTYIPLIYCLLGCYILPTTFYGNQKQPLKKVWKKGSRLYVVFWDGFIYIYLFMYY